MSRGVIFIKGCFKDSYLSFRKDVNKIMDLCNEKRGYNCYDCYSTYCADGVSMGYNYPQYFSIVNLCKTNEGYNNSLETHNDYINQLEKYQNNVSKYEECVNGSEKPEEVDDEVEDEQIDGKVFINENTINNTSEKSYNYEIISAGGTIVQMGNIQNGDTYTVSGLDGLYIVKFTDPKNSQVITIKNIFKK